MALAGSLVQSFFDQVETSLIHMSPDHPRSVIADIFDAEELLSLLIDAVDSKEVPTATPRDTVKQTMAKLGEYPFVIPRSSIDATATHPVR